jgi:hypothetical protein
VESNFSHVPGSCGLEDQILIQRSANPVLTAPRKQRALIDRDSILT